MLILYCCSSEVRFPVQEPQAIFASNTTVVAHRGDTNFFSTAEILASKRSYGHNDINVNFMFLALGFCRVSRIQQHNFASFCTNTWFQYLLWYNSLTIIPISIVRKLNRMSTKSLLAPAYKTLSSCLWINNFRRTVVPEATISLPWN